MDEEPPEDEMGINTTERLSTGCMKADEGVRESRADFKIRGTSVVPNMHWNKNIIGPIKGQWEENKKRERKAAYGKGHAVLDQPFLIPMTQRGMECNLIQPLDTVEEIWIVHEVPDVYRNLCSRSMKFVHTRPLNHIPQFN